MQIKEALKVVPSHHTYVEVFGSPEALLFIKRPSPVEVYNDFSGDLVNLFRVLRDEASYKQLLDLAHNRGGHADTAEVIRAWRFFKTARATFLDGGIVFREQLRADLGQRIPQDVYDYLAGIEALPEFYMRVIRVQIDCLPAQRVIRNFDTDRTLFFINAFAVNEREVEELELDHILGKAIIFGPDRRWSCAIGQQWLRWTPEDGVCVWMNYSQG